MKKNEPINKIMTKNPISVNTSNKMSEARELLSSGSINHLPVVNGKKLIGILSSTDFLKLGFSVFSGESSSLDAVLDGNYKIEEIMSRDVITINESDSVRKAAEVLAEGHFHSLPVINNESELVGITTSTDLIRYLLAQF